MVSDATIGILITTAGGIITAYLAKANPRRIVEDQPQTPPSSASPSSASTTSPLSTSSPQHVTLDLLRPVAPRNTFARSEHATTSGPWPINCGTPEVVSYIKTRAEAEQIAREKIGQDPENTIIEVVDTLGWVSFGWAWTITVKTFNTKDCTATPAPDVNIGKGKRYVAWDNANFKHKDKVTKTIKEGGFEIVFDSSE